MLCRDNTQSRTTRKRADDLTLWEDRSRARTGHAPQVLAIGNNLVLESSAQLGYTSAPGARRQTAALLDEAVN